MTQEATIQNPDNAKPMASANAVAHALKQLENPVKKPLQQLPIQLKLTIGAVNDPLEHEADAMADKVMRMPMKTSFSVSQNNIQRKCNHCEEEENDGMAQRKPLVSFLQKKENSGGEGTASEGVTSQINATKGSGSKLDNQTQSFMESRFGTGFQDVRIHTGGYASELSQQLNAQAFTVGNNVYFNQDKYAPHTSEGKHLLAHELMHTVQQGNGLAKAPFLSKNNEQVQRKLARIDIDAIAEEIHDAFDKWMWWDDDEQIFVNLQRLRKNHNDINKLKAAYQTKYKQDLEAQLRKNMMGKRLRLALEMIGVNDHPEKGNLINKRTPQSSKQYEGAAKRIKTALKGIFVDEETVYGVLIPFNRDAMGLATLKAVYETLAGTELQKDLEDRMSDESLSYALYLLNGLKDEKPNKAKVNAAVGLGAGTNIHSGKVTGGKVNVEQDVKAQGDSDFYSIDYQGGLSSDSRWLQFIWREILYVRPDDVVMHMDDEIRSRGGVRSYHLSADKSKPEHNTDSLSTSNPFYEAAGVNVRKAASTMMLDEPGSRIENIKPLFERGAKMVISRAHFNTFLIRDFRAIYQIGITVEWIYNDKNEPPQEHRLDVAQKINHLPDDVRKTLIKQYPQFSYIQ